jgi:hypothetical protein
VLSSWRRFGGNRLADRLPSYRRYTRNVQVAEAGSIAPALALVVRSLNEPSTTV